MGEKVNIKRRSINLALSHSFDEPKTARCRSPFFNGSSIIGLLKCFKIMNYTYCGFSIVTWHFFANNLQSLFYNYRRIRNAMKNNDVPLN